MKPTHKLKEGDTVFLQFHGTPKPIFSEEGDFWVNVQVVDALENDLYIVKPVSGHGCKVVSIKRLFY